MKSAMLMKVLGGILAVSVIPATAVGITTLSDAGYDPIGTNAKASDVTEDVENAERSGSTAQADKSAQAESADVTTGEISSGAPRSGSAASAQVAGNNESAGSYDPGAIARTPGWPGGMEGQEQKEELEGTEISSSIRFEMVPVTTKVIHYNCYCGADFTDKAAFMQHAAEGTKRGEVHNWHEWVEYVTTYEQRVIYE